MINTLEIKNYRNIKELKLNALGNVNLITGKNNTGKSSLLEAIVLFAKNAEIESLKDILVQRGEDIKELENKNTELKKYITVISSLFFNRDTKVNSGNIIEIEENYNNKQNNKKVSIQFVYVGIDKNANLGLNKNIELRVDEVDNYTLTNGIKINNKVLWIKDVFAEDYNVVENTFDNINFVNAQNYNIKNNSILWENILLSDKVKYVPETLKIIEPKLENIAFKGNAAGKRTAFIRLANSKEVLPIESMGDGINRILSIILAMVNSADGVLLIDEFENGLHYTVQEQLWKVIFDLSKKLNIQVFATTHSQDCIHSFAKVLANEEDKTIGQLFRLDNLEGNIRAVEFDAEDLSVIVEQDIEIR